MTDAVYSSSSSSSNTNAHSNGHAATATPRTRAKYALFPSVVLREAPRPSTTPTGSTASRSGSLSLSHAPSNRLAHQMSSAPTATTATTTTTTTTVTDTPSPLSSSHIINPATIPTRTSSHRATASSDNQHSIPRRLSKKHRSQHSLSSVLQNRRYPQVDERVWMSQGRSHGQKVASNSAPRDYSRDTQSPPTVIGADLIDGSGSSWSQEKENILQGPYAYLESHPGKDIRSQLISAFNEWLQVPASSLAVITRVVAMLHTASLLIDDVEDNSQLRRGIPVAHSIFGTAQTINSANYVYFCALQDLLTLNNPFVIQIYTEELLNLHRGQGMDLFWRDTLTCPTEDDYLEMVGNKTGGLFRLAIKLMCAESPSHNFNPNPDFPHRPANYVPLVNTVGLLFQILDDYRNLSDTIYTQNKGLCEDLTEGKFSFPIIHAIRSDPNNLVLINILKQKTNDEEVKRYAVQYMENCGSFSYTRRVLRGLTKKAMQLADEIDVQEGAQQGKGEHVKQILEKLRVDSGKHSRASASA
ncbi:Putative polyprenyl synthetase, isoprenoid synthase domain superfamily [Septoria linicola]|uniref:Polyprenyl synthetase, isoprenoid synthase domain superfamily n=1 Tax=Septoria linicola TaxID=215465 RepID=A0A9Q9AKF8_9PEZI|nr:putative polyprenyl synthetase, isoprenoid synthase domain superfamily [Septoria linicola]USW47712.1 Putative polyprenyl synthetase, isoprenoid synthase domain superfamily [Septoria linicola]